MIIEKSQWVQERFLMWYRNGKSSQEREASGIMYRRVLEMTVYRVD